MRAYDEEVRLYTPVLQRIIILVAVVIAVPVVLWTITGFVRTYVGRPQIPTFQRVTTAQPADGDTAPSASPNAENASNSTMAGTSSPAPSPASKIVSDPALVASPSVVIPPPSPTAPAAAASAAMTTMSAPASSPSLPPQQPSAMTASPFPAPPPMAPPAIGNALPATNAPPSAPSSSPWSTAPSAAIAGNATTAEADETLPTVAPLKGPVPIPRHRPHVVAMAETAPAGAPGIAPAAAPPTAIPLPRARPAAAPAATPDTDTTDTLPFDRDGAH